MGQGGAIVGTFRILADDEPQQPAQRIPRGKFAILADDAPKSKTLDDIVIGGARDMIVGGARGLKDTIDTGAEWLASGFDKITGADKPTLSSLVTGEPQGEAARVRAMNKAGDADFETQYGASTPAKVGRIGGQVLATLPVGGILAAPVKALANAGVASRVLAPVADAISTAGMRAQGTTGAANLAARTAGGAVTGGASAGLVDPNSAGVGAAIGGAAPGAFKALAVPAGWAGDAAAGLVAPFFKSGQEKIAGGVLRQFATDPDAATAAMRSAREVIPGSKPTAIMAAGDEGLSGLGRTMQNSSPEYASNLSARQTAQNAARTKALEDIAGNVGKLDVAREARDKATGAIREAVLERAGNIEAGPIARKVERMLADPNNAGQTAQQALRNVRAQLATMTGEDGAVHARALYEMRKDINLAMEGKLQGEAANLKFAKGQLQTVKTLIDDAIEQASMRAKPTGTALTAPGANIALPGGARRPVETWGDYLKTYTEMSKPINQMETLSDVLKRIQGGTTDKEGNAVLSAAKLNNILKNEGAKLSKVLKPDQFDLLRSLAADLNASQLASSSGKAVGSNTVQNLAQGEILQRALGATMGKSTPATAIIGRLLQIPYGTANAQIQSRVAQALLDPAEATRLLARKAAAQSPALDALLRGSGAAAARTAPILGTDAR